MKNYFAFFGLIFLAACGGNNKPDTSTSNDIDTSIIPPAIPSIPFTITAQYPHAEDAFTEGLQIYKGKLYEGTGMETKSSLRIADIKTGVVEKKYHYEDPLIFGEGIQVFKGKIYQLTWKNNKVFIFDEKNISKPIKTLTWPYQGWGMTNNGTDLLVSDGSANIYTVNANDFSVKSKISVTENGTLVDNINELEFIDGFIYANVWGEDKNFILKIDPINGHILGKINVGNLKTQFFSNSPNADVLNGIAYDSTSKKMYITGKYWPKIFEIKLN